MTSNLVLNPQKWQIKSAVKEQVRGDDKSSCADNHLISDNNISQSYLHKQAYHFMQENPTVNPPPPNEQPIERKRPTNAKLEPLSIDYIQNTQTALHESMIHIKLQNSSQQLEPSPGKNRIQIGQDYDPADFQKAVLYRQSQSYYKKLQGREEREEYQPMEACGSNLQLKQYGVGVYLYMEFMRRLAITLFFMSVILIFPLATNFKGSGLSQYTASGSFTIMLAKFTLGNLSNASRQDYLIITVTDVLSMVVLLVFYIHWRHFHRTTIQEFNANHATLNPASYAVSVEQFHDPSTNLRTLEGELKSYLDKNGWKVFEVQVVCDYHGNFDKFMALEQQLEILQKESLMVWHLNKPDQKFQQQSKNLEIIQDELKQLSQAFEPLYAIIHFATLNSKLAFLNHCKRHHLQNTLAQALNRSLCCIPQPEKKLLFLQKFPMLINTDRLSRPQEINWRNVDLSNISVIFRWVFSLLIVVICILVTSALIGFCTLYVASTSSCQNYKFSSSGNTQTDTALISNMGSSAKFCYCSQHITDIYSDIYIKALCSNIASMVIMTEGLQIAASVVSSITNVMLTILISVIAQRLLRPITIPKEYVFVFWGVLISNLINSCVIPLLLNANIFGVQFVSYLKFIDFMDFTQIAVFSDFTSNWYAFIAPYYLNILIIASFVSPLIGLAWFALRDWFMRWRLKHACEQPDKQNPLIQKQANKRISSLSFQFAAQHSQIMLYLLITIMYSGLIPLLVPVFALGIIICYFCKRTILIKYSVKIPADQTLNQSVINIIPFIILAHALFSVWSHSAQGIFASNASVAQLNWTIFHSQFDRIFIDAIILGEAAVIAAIIGVEYTLVNLVRFIKKCYKAELEMPIALKDMQNVQYSTRLSRTNILGSYKLINSPVYGHALKAYKELMLKIKHRKGQLKKADLEDTRIELR